MPDASFFLQTQKNKIIIIFSIVVVMGLLLFFCTVWGQRNSFTQKTNMQLPNIGDTPETTESAGKVTVSISGAVRNPDVYTLPLGSRIADLISVSGGMLDTADISIIESHLNFAQKLEESSCVYIPYTFSSSNPQSSCSITVSSTSSCIAASTSTISNSSGASDKNENDLSNKSINSMTKDELMALKGIGEVYASKIIANKPYKNFEDLVERSSVPKTILENNKQLLGY